ncbi:MAG: putative 4-hydroxybenzoate polyprenyltransferase [Thermoanaerobaculia bacterium]|nr:putative 4-hydroxybenzoate polyprenyltransferase [Thermoanaerobaculia bacterium]
MKKYLSLVKFSHTLFAMPFALVGFFIASTGASGGLSWRLLGLVVLCMVFARSAAMGFNRWLDRDVDAVNPRTRMRELPAGVIKPKSALLFVIVNCLFFIATTFFINRLCFFLSPVALAVVLGYSYTKRFTWLCHLVLGLGLALAPVGAYLAVAGRFDWIPVLYGLAVMLWTGGFDVIYALQDEQFDQEHRLYSMPAFFGKARALRISEWMHLGSAALMVYAGRLLHSELPQANDLLWLGTGIFLALLFYQHRLVKPDDLSKVNLAFFTTNGFASLIFGTLTIIDLLI